MATNLPGVSLNKPNTLRDRQLDMVDQNRAVWFIINLKPVQHSKQAHKQSLREKIDDEPGSKTG